MIKIHVLVENNSIHEHYKSVHGLSVLINYNGKNILLDAGPDDKFMENAAKMNCDLKKVEYMFISHAHHDHSGGLNRFIETNAAAAVFLMDKAGSEYYAKSGNTHIPIGLNLKSGHYSRLTQLSADITVENTIHFLKNTIAEYRKPAFNNVLYKKENNKIVNDTFDHEGILVMEDGNNELVVFDSCSHNGIMNIIKTVNTKIPAKRIRSYVGGLHLFNPQTEEHETDEYLDYLVKNIKETSMTIYTGHCTGKYALNYLKEKLGARIREIHTGMELEV